MKPSPKTTVFGLLSGIGMALMAQPGVPPWLHTVGLILSAVGTACMGAAARDNNKTSEDVGAVTKDPAPKS